MTAEEAIAYLNHYSWSATRLGLGRTRELLARLGNPQKGLKFIHVAGSNGKGSSCAMFESVLRAAGYRTGLYISPYVERFEERIQSGGRLIPPERLASVTERVRAAAEAMEDHPSQFELITAAAMLYYAEERCDIVVLEVGMGGEKDSTNAIDAPELAVVANIGLEHTEYLGNTIGEIAATKAGIIKPGCACACYDGPPEATAVLRRVCAEKGVPLRRADLSRLEQLENSLDGQRFRWDGREYRIPLLGPHQLHNAALVLTGLELLRERGWELPEDAVRDGLARVRWPARLEVLRREPLFLLDGGHNPQCAEALAQSLDALLPGQKLVFLTGVLADKDYGRIYERLLPRASEFICVTPDSPRALAGEALAAYLRSRGAKAESRADVGEALSLTLERARNGPAAAFGSLYLAGQVRTLFRNF
ncbi:MAG: bifunctional folylpolyglutamate synthase/dihydrofolate synthase [Oscillospiraceae bacterium]|nr:bifunctional folylpolyglutamate synthase/dihydrofolate synthase [Oscillospiraceae bacterium]